MSIQPDKVTMEKDIGKAAKNLNAEELTIYQFK